MAQFTTDPYPGEYKKTMEKKTMEENNSVEQMHSKIGH